MELSIAPGESGHGVKSYGKAWVCLLGRSINAEG